MFRTYGLAVTACGLVAALVAGCTGGAPQEAAKPGALQSVTQEKVESQQTVYPLTIKDDAGREVTLTAEPKRILSLAPSNTELLFALGEGANLVGRTDFCDFPAEVSKVPSVGSLFPANYEQILATKPDLVLMTTGSDDVRTKLATEYKLNVFVVDPQSLDALYGGIAKLGQVLNTRDAADKLVVDMQTKVKAVTDKIATAAGKPKVYYEVWDEPLMTAGTGTFINELITLAGGVNIGAEVQGWTNYSAEQVAKANPDIIIASSKEIEAKVKARQGWESFKAVKEGKVVTVADANHVSRPGPRLVLGLQWLAQTLHPELFK